MYAVCVFLLTVYPYRTLTCVMSIVCVLLFRVHHGRAPRHAAIPTSHGTNTSTHDIGLTLHR